MSNELKSLYKLKARLTKDFEDATRCLPEKKALDHTVSLIAILESCLYENGTGFGEGHTHAEQEAAYSR